MVIAAAQTERDRLLLRVLWATGGRVSEVLTLRAADVRRDALVLPRSKAGRAGAPAPVHPHRFRHARVRQIVRQTNSLPLVQKQAGWSRLQLAYLTISDDEARELMRRVDD